MAILLTAIAGAILLGYAFVHGFKGPASYILISSGGACEIGAFLAIAILICKKSPQNALTVSKNSKKNAPGKLITLPLDLLKKIILNSNWPEILSMRRVCKKFNLLVPVQPSILTFTLETIIHVKKLSEGQFIQFSQKGTYKKRLWNGTDLDEKKINDSERNSLLWTRSSSPSRLLFINNNYYRYLFDNETHTLKAEHRNSDRYENLHIIDENRIGIQNTADYQQPNGYSTFFIDEPNKQPEEGLILNHDKIVQSDLDLQEEKQSQSFPPYILKATPFSEGYFLLVNHDKTYFWYGKQSGIRAVYVVQENQKWEPKFVTDASAFCLLDHSKVAFGYPNGKLKVVQFSQKGDFQLITTCNTHSKIFDLKYESNKLYILDRYGLTVRNSTNLEAVTKIGLPNPKIENYDSGLFFRENLIVVEDNGFTIHQVWDMETLLAK